MLPLRALPCFEQFPLVGTPVASILRGDADEDRTAVVVEFHVGGDEHRKP